MRRALLALAGLVAMAAADAATEIRLWHAMNGAREVQIEALAQRFNVSQREYRVVAIRKGGEAETLRAVLDWRRDRSPPHIVQIEDIGAADVLARRGAVRPLWRVAADTGVQVDPKTYFEPVARHFTDARGMLVALPFSAATPVLYYNRDALRRAGLDPNRPPRTWYEMPDVLGALRQAGQRCAFTTAWPSWVLFENMSAWHSQRFLALPESEDTAPPRLVFNTHLMVRWIAMLASWSKSGYFTYTGRKDEGEAKFASGECALLTSSSSSYPALRRAADFDLGVAQIPYYDDLPGAPHATLVGGAGLWVVEGRRPAEYRGVAKFFAFLMRPEIQADWHQKSGSLPLTNAAYALSDRQGYYARFPGEQIAIRQLTLNGARPAAESARLGELRQVRSIIDEEMEAVWAGRNAPLDALNAAVARGNAFLRRVPRSESPIP